jgi:hypothetical protein
MNGTGSARSYRVRFNTLFRNGINLYLASPGGQYVVNNFSVGPGEYHVVVTGRHAGSELDYNLYVPDGRFLLHNTSNSALDRQTSSLRAFRTERKWEAHSRASNTANFVSPLPQTPKDFRLTELSPARGRGLASGLEDGDYGGRARPSGSGADIGAWARYSSDG